jgi:ribonuclease P protein component
MRRENRLTSAREFRRTLADGKRASVDGVICFALSGVAGPARIGVTTTRKFGGAVGRNRAKRLLRETARRILPDLAPGTQVVLMATPAMNGKSFQEVAEAVRAAAKQAAG